LFKLIKNNNSLQFILSCLFACLIWLSAKIEFVVIGSPVPQSAQTLIVVLAGSILKRPWGVFAVFLYLLFGLVGLPVFSDSGSGISHLLNKTGGYLLGFLFASIYLQSIKPTSMPIKMLINFLIAHIIILSLGFLWLARFINYTNAWNFGVKPFLIGALLKSVIALIIVVLITTKKKSEKTFNRK